MFLSPVEGGNDFAGALCCRCSSAPDNPGLVGQLNTGLSLERLRHVMLKRGDLLVVVQAT